MTIEHLTSMRLSVRLRYFSGLKNDFVTEPPSCLALTPPDAKGTQRSATRKVGRDRTPGVIG
jgi:hypothetical protein